jgi:hypothetical protein
MPTQFDGVLEFGLELPIASQGFQAFEEAIVEFV